ncbi:oligosaccharide flippase family protein [Clostridium perfringens]|nr:oligosaccharide flippase family protein [Clostridium perfringens]
MNRNKRLARNTVIYFIGNISTKLMSFLLLPLYTAYLSPTDYGEVDLIFTYTSIIIPIMTLQITFAAFRYLFDTNKYEEQRKIISNAVIVQLIGMGIFTIIYIIIWNIFKFNMGFIIIIYLFLSSFSSMMQQLIRGLGKNVIFASVGVISTAVQLFCNVIFIVGIGMRSTALIISPIIASIISIIYMFISVRIYRYFSFKKFDIEEIKYMLKYSIPLVPDAICWWLLLGFGRMFLSFTNGVEAVGIYAVANKFPSLLTMFYSIFNLAWQENSFSEYDKLDRDEYYSNIYNGLSKFIIAIVIIVIPFTNLVAPFMIGKNFESSYLCIPILYLAATLNILSTFYGSGFESAKNTRGILISTLLSMITNIIFNLILTPSFGVFGASISLAISYGILLISRIKRSKQFFNINVDKRAVSILSIFIFINLILYYISNDIVQMALVILGVIIFIVFNINFIKSIIFILIRKNRL